MKLSQLKIDPFGMLMTVLPKNHLSRVVGELMHFKLPGALSSMSVEGFAKLYNINLDEAELPVSEYKTIGELFTRKLKAGARPILGELVHPVDAVISEWGSIVDDTLIQAKDKKYSLTAMLGSELMAAPFQGGTFITYYLCPTDYHRIHSPVSGEISDCIWIPGKLWPVNSWSVSNVEHLFSVNERLITFVQTARGPVAVVKVGATNVGKITTSYDSTMVTNQASVSEPVHRQYEPRISVRAGDELGMFHMGSTVVMVYPPGYIHLPEGADLRGPVKMGTLL